MKSIKLYPGNNPDRDNIIILSRKKSQTLESTFHGLLYSRKILFVEKCVVKCVVIQLRCSFDIVKK